ncbi:MAG TPA: YigZ family protein, partial [Aggregatilineales bacterium]|nr:YigZ family protein [Aggregatilineales bacterium]
AATVRAETEVRRSRFIATIGNVETVEQARAFVAAVRAEMPDASHHVYAFKVGYGASVNEGLSDDGEPSGTSGPPVLEVLRGAAIGDAVIVVTRYFGGTKLGTGGLARAYRDAARQVLEQCPLHEKVDLRRLALQVPYSLYERIKRAAAVHQATIEHEDFAGDVSLTLLLPSDNVDSLTVVVRDLSSGRISPTPID